jgi:hypothetical protein
MAYYHICPDCGAALDPDERCDCQDRKPAAYCFMCSRPLYPEDSSHDQDPAYEIDGHVLCEDCVDKYVRDNCRKVLPFVTVPNDYGTHKELY